MIGICDSGIGGLTVVREVMHRLPGFSILYLGDTARTPYGNKSPETIKQYAMEDIEFLMSRGAKIIIIACNTMSALALSQVRERFNIPIFDVVRPAVTRAMYKSPYKRIGVIGTRATINSKIYEHLIRDTNRDAAVESIACPLLVPLVEEGMITHTETKRILRSYLGPLRLKQIDTLILGCTHYPFLKPMIADRMGRRVGLVDSAEAVAKHLRAYLDAKPQFVDRLSKGNRHEFYLTDVSPHYNEVASRWLEQPVEFRRVDLSTDKVKS